MEPTDVLPAGETPIGWLAADGFFADSYGGSVSSPHVVLTDRRFVLVDRRGTFSKRFEEQASWPLSSFTSRVNTSEGSALGAGRFVLALFPEAGGAVATGFRSEAQRQKFYTLVLRALGPQVS